MLTIKIILDPFSPRKLGVILRILYLYLPSKDVLKVLDTKIFIGTKAIKLSKTERLFVNVLLILGF